MKKILLFLSLTLAAASGSACADTTTAPAVKQTATTANACMFVRSGADSVLVCEDPK